MKLKIGIASLIIFALAACNDRQETVTGSYGQAMLAGQVVMDSGSPAGVRVSVRGTGMTTTLADDGQFVFAGVPGGATLDFVRSADNIEASMQVDANDGYLVVALAQTTARKSSRRRSAGPTRDQVTEFEGVISAVAADSIVVFTSHKEEVTVGLDASTVIRKGNGALTAADLVVGARVHVKAKKVEDAWLAVQVIVQNAGGDDGEDGGDDSPAVREYEGTVQTASATELVVLTSHRATETFVITAETVIRKGNTPVAAADILPGTRVHVKAAAAADGTKTAVQVTVQNMH